MSGLRGESKLCDAMSMSRIALCSGVVLVVVGVRLLFFLFVCFAFLFMHCYGVRGFFDRTVSL